MLIDSHVFSCVVTDKVSKAQQISATVGVRLPP